jgi:glycosyl transferase family 25
VGSAVLDKDWAVLVISLRDDEARRERLLSALARMGLPAQVVEAVDGRAGLPAWAEAEIDRDAATRRVGRPLADVELACTLSHRRAWQHVLDAGLAGALVFEDDAIPTDRLARLLSAGGHRAADLVQFDHQDARVWRAGLRMGPEREIFPGTRLVPVAANASLANGYAISARGARHLVAKATPVGGLADWPCDTTALGALIALPPVVGHPPVDPGQSRLETARRRMVAGAVPADPRWRRFARADYWRRWWFKRRTVKVS